LTIVEWAERYGLKASRVKCCPWWLTRNASRRCEFSKCASDERWLDHPICWIRGGKPIAITSPPYDDKVADNARIKSWLDHDDRLSVAFGKGWYGPATTQVVMWRNDRALVIEPATDDGGWYDLMRRSAQMATDEAA
jgi:hypothetical protein